MRILTGFFSQSRPLVTVDQSRRGPVDQSPPSDSALANEIYVPPIRGRGSQFGACAPRHAGPELPARLSRGAILQRAAAAAEAAERDSVRNGGEGRGYGVGVVTERGPRGGGWAYGVGWGAVGELCGGRGGGGNLWGWACRASGAGVRPIGAVGRVWGLWDECETCRAGVRPIGAVGPVGAVGRVWGLGGGLWGGFGAYGMGLWGPLGPEGSLEGIWGRGGVLGVYGVDLGSMGRICGAQVGFGRDMGQIWGLWDESMGIHGAEVGQGAICGVSVGSQCDRGLFVGYLWAFCEVSMGQELPVGLLQGVCGAGVIYGVSVGRGVSVGLLWGRGYLWDPYGEGVIYGVSVRTLGDLCKARAIYGVCIGVSRG